MYFLSLVLILLCCLHHSQRRFGFGHEFPGSAGEPTSVPLNFEQQMLVSALLEKLKFGISEILKCLVTLRPQFLTKSSPAVSMGFQGMEMMRKTQIWFIRCWQQLKQPQPRFCGVPGGDGGGEMNHREKMREQSHCWDFGGAALGFQRFPWDTGISAVSDFGM